MAERIEFVGNPLPTGLPGFGGGTVSVLTLPGFNAVVAVQQFGPVVNAPTVTPPTPTPPPGSNPENPTPTPTPVPPAPAPLPPATQNIPNLCKTCETQDDVGDKPILRGERLEDSCVPCGGSGAVKIIRYFTEPAATSKETGIFYGSGSVLRGKESGKKWEIDANPSVGLEIGIAGNEDGCALRKDKVYVGTTEYRKGATIYDADTGRTYSGQSLTICNGTKEETWYVLAHK